RGRGPALGVVRQPLGDGPFVFDTAEQHKVRVVVVTKGLAKPWSLAFLPDGSMLITELQKGQLRLVRNGVLDPAPVPGVPQSAAVSLGGLMDVVLHPRFAENHIVYLTYGKPNGQGQIATALARGRWDEATKSLRDTPSPFGPAPHWNGPGRAGRPPAHRPDAKPYPTPGPPVPQL